MNELILKIQDLLADRGAPDWLQKPGTWVMIGCGLVATMVLLRLLFKRRPAVDPTAEEQENPRTDDEPSGGVFGPLTGALAAQIPESEKERKEFGQMLRSAGMYSRTARSSIYAYRFLLMTFPMLCAGLLVIFSPPAHTWPILIGGGILSATLSIIPRLYVWYRRQTRVHEITTGLADMLDMLSMCLSGGMSISSSLDHVARNLASYPSLAEELQIMRRQSDVGSLRHALVDWANRIDTPEVRQVANLLSRGDSLGTAMSGSLLVQADHFRTARKQLATLRANRMPVFLTFPLLFCFAPAVLIVLMSPSFMQLSEFLDPNNANNPMANNETINTSRVVQQIQSLDQNVSALQPPPSSSRAGQTEPRRSLQAPARQLPRINQNPPPR